MHGNYFLKEPSQLQVSVPGDWNRKNTAHKKVNQVHVVTNPSVHQKLLTIPNHTHYQRFETQFKSFNKYYLTVICYTDVTHINTKER